MGRDPAYPFAPRSTAYLDAGQFWSIPPRACPSQGDHDDRRRDPHQGGTAVVGGTPRFSLEAARSDHLGVERGLAAHTRGRTSAYGLVHVESWGESDRFGGRAWRPGS